MPATETPAPVPSTTPASPAAPADATVAASAAAEKAAKKKVEEAKEAAEREKHFKSEGYTVRMNSGKKYFCINNAPTGSHIARERCYDEDVLVVMEAQAARDKANDTGNGTPSPLKSSGPGN